MAATRTRRVRGFTLPLTMALAFSLMALATAVVGMVVVSDRQAKAAAESLVVRTTLESAIESSLFHLERDGEPEAAEWADHETLNGLDVAVSLQPVRYKPDINIGDPAEVGAAFADPGLGARAAAALTASAAPPDANAADANTLAASNFPTPFKLSNSLLTNSAAPAAARGTFDRFADFAQAVGATPVEEDCLRRRLTIGAPQEHPQAIPPQTALVPPRDPLKADEVIDVRATVRDWQGRYEALWRRVRFTGKPERAWLTHDWRELRLGRTDGDCPAPQAAPTISNALRPTL